MFENGCKPEWLGLCYQGNNIIFSKHFDLILLLNIEELNSYLQISVYDKGLKGVVEIRTGRYQINQYL